jgi:probable HAF family extracellular repeat protein
MFAHDRSWKRSPLARTLVTLAAAPALSLLFAFAAPMVRAEAPIYALHDLGTLPGETFSIPWAINASGQIVGWSGVSPPRAFIYKGSGMVALPGLPGQTYTLARGINDAGVVVGGGWAPGGAEVALRWNGGVPEALGVIEGSSESWDINEAGVSIGSSPTPGGGLTGHAFMHTDAGGMVDIAPTGNAGAFDVNDRGDVTGTFNNGAFLWSPKTGLQFLGSLPDFTYGNGRAVNNAGQVAGFSVNGYGNSSRVWRYTPGVGMVNLGGVGESNVVWGMNSQGDIVGQGTPAPGGLKRAIVYTDALGLRALNDLIDASPRWFLLAATDINDAGQIVAYGLDNVSGLQKAVRLDPIPRAGVEGVPAPRALQLAPPVPNPSKGESRFVLTLGRAQRVSVGVYDVAGHQVASLHDGLLDPGSHPFQLDGRGLPSGLYFIQARGEGGTTTQRFTIFR